jgi:RNA polymerase sigma factor (sigma-70 family)
VEDVVSETFLTAWRRLDEIPGDAIPWLFVTARNVMANRRRANERRGVLGDKLAADRPSHVELRDGADVDERVLAAIRSLPDLEREAFMLVAWDGLDNARAARAAGCGAATFRMRVHRARRKLRRYLGSERPLARKIDIHTSLEEPQ